MNGSLGSRNLADVLQELIRGRRSGLLFLRRGESEKALYLSDGQIRNAESSQREDGLAFQILEEGLLAPQQLESAMRRVEPGRTLAAVLADEGSIGGSELRRLEQATARQIVLSLFDWNDGSFMYQEGDFGFKGVVELNTASIILEGVRRMFDFDRQRDTILADRRALRATTAAAVPLDLEPTEGFILSRIDGVATASDICAMSIISEDMTCRVLYGLLAAGIIAYADSPTGATPRPASTKAAATATSAAAARPDLGTTMRAPSRPAAEPVPTRSQGTPRPVASPTASPATAESGAFSTPSLSEQQARIREIEGLFAAVDAQSPYELLGVGAAAATAEIEAAFAAKSARIHPSKLPWLNDSEHRNKLVYIFGKLRAAHQILVDGNRRRDYDTAAASYTGTLTADSHMRMEFTKTDRQRELEERHKEARALFGEATALFAKERFHDARVKALRAIQLAPEEATFYALTASIEMLNPNLRWQKDAESHWRKAMELDPWNAEYAASLGRLYKQAGMHSKAKREFIRALELEPTHAFALGEVPPAERPARKAPPTQTETAEDEEDEPEVL